MMSVPLPLSWQLGKMGWDKMGASKSREVFPPLSVQHLLILLLVSNTQKISSYSISE